MLTIRHNFKALSLLFATALFLIAVPAGHAGTTFPESPHPYAPNTDQTWTYTLEGNPAEILVTFHEFTNTEPGFDFIHVIDGNGDPIAGSPFTGGVLAAQTVTVPGDTVQIRLVSDHSVQSWGFKVIDVQANGIQEEPPVSEFPDDTVPPTGSVHATPNKLWPANNQMVRVLVEGYIRDELSTVRDGTNGISEAKLVVNGEEIPLTNLGEDGGFSTSVELKAENGAVYLIQLHGADTNPADAGGPNSGLVDSIAVTVPDNSALVAPEDGADLLRWRRATFEWDFESCMAEKIEFSADGEFSRAVSFALEPGATSWTPNWRAWLEVKKMGRRGNTVHWRVIGTDSGGFAVKSETFSFRFQHRRHRWWRSWFF